MTNRISGIYMIRSKRKPERCYIGSAVNIRQRWERHKSLLGRNVHHSKKLQNHVNKYGYSDLSFSILVECDKSELISSEQFFIDVYKPYFNISPSAGSSLGYKHSKESINKMRAWERHPISEETRRKMSAASKGRIKSDEERRKRKESLKGKMPTWKGRKHTDEWRKRMSELKKNQSIETRKKISAALKGHMGAMRGKHHTEETKKKISQIHKGKVVSIKTREKMREAGRIKIFTKEHKRNLSLGHTGKKQSIETIQKRILSVKRYHENKKRIA